MPVMKAPMFIVNEEFRTKKIQRQHRRSSFHGNVPTIGTYVLLLHTTTDTGSDTTQSIKRTLNQKTQPKQSLPSNKFILKIKTKQGHQWDLQPTDTETIW